MSVYLIKQCLRCKKEFTALIKEHKRGYAKYCSKSCAAKSNKKPKIPNACCDWCYKPFYRPTKKLTNTKSGLHFCSRKCKDSAQRLDGISLLHPPHYSSGNFAKYRRYALSSLDHECNRCGYSDHVEILIVHHIDRNRRNNKLSNLEILCPNCHDTERLINKDGRFYHLAH